MEKPLKPKPSLFVDGDRSDVEALTRIYEDAIPASERKPLSTLLADPACRFTFARGRSGLSGFAIVREGASADLLEYIAVAALERGRGIGAELYGAARDLTDTPGKPLLIEVDSDRETASDLETRARRKDFYRRLGGREIQGLAYLLPLNTAGPPPAMDLMIDRWPNNSVSRAVLMNWLTELYSDAYGQSRDDPRILRMVAALDEAVPIV